MNMISTNPLMDSFGFNNYFPLLSCSSSSSTPPNNNFLDYDGFHSAKQNEHQLGLRVSDVEALPAANSAADINGNGVFESKHLEGSSEEKQATKSGKKKGEKVRRPRYAFRTRSQVDILDDGYRWRKYGQKAVKNNKFPRSYYRCTYQGCGVKKQVQRLTGDEEVVVTTYEGVHSHPINKSTDNFEHILSQLQIYGNGTPFGQ